MLRFPLLDPPVGFPFELNQASAQAQGLIGWWPSLGSFQAARLRDLAAPRNHTTLTGGATWAAAEVQGGVLSLDGSDDYADAGAVSNLGLSGDAAYSIGVWVNLAAFRNDGMWFSYGAASAGRVISIGTDGSGRVYSVHYGSDHAYTTYGALSTNVWYHLVITYNPATSTETLYVNGLSKETWTPTDLGLTAGDNLYIGRATWNGTYAGQCKLGDIRLYNRCLAASEVLAMYLPQTRWELYAPLIPDPYYVEPPAAPPPHAASNAAPTLYRPPDRLEPRYEIYLTDITTRRLALVRRFESLTYSKRLNGVGEFELTLPGNFNTSLIREGGLIEIHRAHDKSLEPHVEYVGFILSQPRYFTRGGGKYVKVGGADLNHMLTWREQVGYTATAELLNEADDNMRYFFDVNLGLGAAADRSLVNAYGITREPDRHWAQAMYMSVNRRPLLDYMGELAKQSAENNNKRIKLFYGMVVTQLNPLKVQFQVRPHLWGVDHTIKGSLPVILRPWRGLRDTILENDAKDEKTAIYIEYNAGTLATPVTNDARLETWSGGRREGYININSTSDASVAADAGRIELRAQRRVYRVRGEVEQRRGMAYGDYHMGDHISLAADDVLSSARVDSVTVTVAGGGEQVSVKYEYVD